LPGDSEREFLIFTHCCHPSLCNDNLSGIGVATALARYVAQHDHRFTYRFVFAPATIGSITWLAQHQSMLTRIEHGLILGLLGDTAGLSYKRSRDSDTNIDRIAEFVLATEFSDTRIREFSPYGYDERQFCSPGINLPVGRLTRSSNGEYDCYHSSADDLSFISARALGEAFLACVKILSVAEGCCRYVNQAPKCEPRLGKYGLYGAVGGAGPSEFEHALLWVLNQSDGSNDLIDIARRSSTRYALVAAAADALVRAGLLAPLD
jgi:aminopeptidase-like protein